MFDGAEDTKDTILHFFNLQNSHLRSWQEFLVIFLLQLVDKGNNCILTAPHKITLAK